MFSPITDWAGTFQPMVLRLLNGQSLDGHEFYNPPYVLAPLIPFALLGEDSRILFFTVALGAFALIAMRLNPAWWGVLVVCLSPFVLMSLKYENIEWLVLLGLIMPRPIGMLFLLIKPQMSLLMVGYWVYQAWKSKALLRLILPSLAALALSFVMDSDWVVRLFSYSQNRGSIANFSLYPYGILIAIALMWLAWTRRRDTFAIGATPFVMPVVTATAWAGLPFALLHSWRLSLLGLIAQWAIIIRALG